MNFIDFVNSLDRMGVADVILPFFLVFVLVFAILKKIKIFGTDKKTKKYNIIIAVVLGAAVVFPHIIGNGPDIVPVINNALPHVSVIIIAIIMFLILLGAFGAKYDIAGVSMGGIVSIVAAIIIVYIFGAAAGWGWRIPRSLAFLEDPETVTLLIILLVFGIIIHYITKEDVSEEEKKKRKGFWKIVNEPLKKP